MDDAIARRRHAHGLVLVRPVVPGVLGPVAGAVVAPDHLGVVAAAHAGGLAVDHHGNTGGDLAPERGQADGGVGGTDLAGDAGVDHEIAGEAGLVGVQLLGRVAPVPVLADLHGVAREQAAVSADGGSAAVAEEVILPARVVLAVEGDGRRVGDAQGPAGRAGRVVGRHDVFRQIDLVHGRDLVVGVDVLEQGAVVPIDVAEDDVVSTVDRDLVRGNPLVAVLEGAHDGRSG